VNPYSDFSFPWFDQFLIWLSTTDLRLFLYRFEDWDWLFVFLHVASAAMLFGAILIVDMRLIGVMRRLDLRQLAALTLPWAVGGALVAIVTGVVLLMFDPVAHGVHTYFLPKMALIVLGFANALAFHGLTKLDSADAHVVRSRVSGAVSIALWTGVFLCASLNATERIQATSHAEMGAD
jgi:hypothetical protein